MKTTHEDRPVLTLAQLREKGLRRVKAYLRTADFLAAAKELSGHSIARRVLQFVSSPGLRIVPLPEHFGGHRAHHRHPEDTTRLAVLLTLTKSYLMPLREARRILRALPAELYELVLAEALTVPEIVNLAAFGGGREAAERALFSRVAKLLAAAAWTADGGVRRAVGSEELQRSLDRFHAWLEGLDSGATTSRAPQTERAFAALGRA